MFVQEEEVQEINSLALARVIDIEMLRRSVRVSECINLSHELEFPVLVKFVCDEYYLLPGLVAM